MNGNQRFSGFGRFFHTLGSAVAVAAAVEAGRKPKSRDLETLGIDSRAFDHIRRF